MSAITFLGGDFEILFSDETVGSNAVAGLRMVRRTSTAGPTVYTANQVYSGIAENSDAFQAMGFENPQLPITPTAYKMENGYFIPRSTTEFMKGGSITADWTNEIRSIEYSQSVAFVFADIGRQVVGGTTGDTGTLLDFEILPNGNLLLWIRPDDILTDLFDNNSETLSVTADSGTGSGTASASSTTGITLFSALQVIGSVPTSTEVFLYQERLKMTSSDGTFQWWVTDATLSLGIINILVRVQRDNILIANGDIEVFSRRYTSLYDQFKLNIAEGGRSSLPLASQPDINNTTGYLRSNWDGGSGSAMKVGDVLTNVTVPGTLLVVTSVLVDLTTTGTFAYYLIGDLTAFNDNDVFTSTNISGNIQGVPIVNLGGPTDTAVGEGGSVTIVLGTTTVDHDGDGTAEPWSITVDAQGDVLSAKVYERFKYATRRGATASDLFGSGVNVPGESYRGLQAQIPYDAPSGTFNQGDDVNGPTTWSARIMSVNISDAYIMVTDQQTSLDTVLDNDILSDESSNTITVNGVPSQFAVSKQSPLGTYTGTQMFLTRGVIVINPAPTDTQNYIGNDDNDIRRIPPNLVSVTVSNIAVGYRVLVADDNGTAGTINKDRFGGIGTVSGLNNGLGDIQIFVGTLIDSNVAQAGFLRVVDIINQEEHRYVYNSRNTTTLFLRNVVEGTGVTTASASQVIDTTADFTNLSNPVEVGMLVRNITAGKTTHVWEVTNVVSATILDVDLLYGPGIPVQDWDITDSYQINRLIGNHTTPGDYTTTDNLYAPIIDAQADSSSISNNIVQTNPFGIVTNVRQGKVILPFTQNSTVLANGVSITTVATPDTIAT